MIRTVEGTGCRILNKADTRLLGENHTTPGNYCEFHLPLSFSGRNFSPWQFCVKIKGSDQSIELEGILSEVMVTTADIVSHLIRWS